MPLNKTFQKIPFTASAYQKMQLDLELLQQEEQAIIERVKAAREQGDLSENGAYKYAKFELGNVRRKMRRLQRLLLYGEVVEKQENADRIGFGNTVTLQAGEKRVIYTIVSKHESDPLKGFLSQESPLGQRLMGKKIGESFEFVTSAGTLLYRIDNIE
jgi:transcription elongation factor GreA